ncbi:MAG: leucine-rich repeat domain-containing protein [Alphaproteobacteria bacterium]|nr:leucine-rich repeat domain-containing protein [Alphaproteobacteria bacterium]
MKKVWGLCGFLIFGIYPLATMAGIIAEGDDCGQHCHWEIDTETKTLKVIGSGEMKNYSRPCTTSANCRTTAPWVDYSADIKNIDISEGFTSLGTAAFADLYVNDVHLPSTLEVIGDVALESHFYNINIPDSLKTIGFQALNANNLTELILNDGLVSIGSYALAQGKLETLVIPDSVTYISANVFGDTREGWNHSLIKKLYCSKDIEEQCKKAAELNQAEVVSYTKTKDGKYLIGGKIYNSANDVLKGLYIPKRIYTIEEAEKASKKTGNTFRLRYK